MGTGKHSLVISLSSQSKGSRARGWKSCSITQHVQDQSELSVKKKKRKGQVTQNKQNIRGQECSSVEHPHSPEEAKALGPISSTGAEGHSWRVGGQIEPGMSL